MKAFVLCLGHLTGLLHVSEVHEATFITWIMLIFFQFEIKGLQIGYRLKESVDFILPVQLDVWILVCGILIGFHLVIRRVTANLHDLILYINPIATESTFSNAAGPMQWFLLLNLTAYANRAFIRGLLKICRLELQQVVCSSYCLNVDLRYHLCGCSCIRFIFELLVFHL